jgi:acyl carrier protein
MTIEDQLLKYFKENGGAEVAIDTHLVEEGIIDSMGVMDLIEFIEDMYELGLDMDDLIIENFVTVNDIRNLIMSKREAA